MFKVFNETGFVVAFPNGYEVSVMFAKGNYGAVSARTLYEEGMTKSGLAEIIVFVSGTNRCLNDKILNIPGVEAGGDGITFGWSTPDTFALIVAKVQQLPPGLHGRE